MRNLIGRFFKQYFVLLCINQMASALFRLMAALGRDIIVANTVGAFALLTVMVLGGFVISRGKKKRFHVTSKLSDVMSIFNDKSVFCIRGCAQMVSMGFLVLTTYVWTECYCCE